MASFAKIGLNNKVIEILSAHNNELLDANGVEQEINGIDFLTKLTGWAIWKQTSYNTHGGVHSSGGKGVVILSVPDANYSGTTTGSPTVATGVSGKTVLTFTGTGSYTA